MNAVANIEGTLASAMAAAFAEIEGATKSAQGQVGQQKYKYADLTSVLEAIKPALTQHGLFFTQCPEPSERGVTIKTVLHHASGESLDLGTLFVPANKSDAQGYGSALTYARRYALVTAFGVPVEDDDGNAATKAQAAAPKIVTDNEWAIITQLIEATNTDARQFCEAYNIESVKVLPSAAFPKAEAQLKRKLAKMGEQSNG